MDLFQCYAFLVWHNLFLSRILCACVLLHMFMDLVNILKKWNWYFWHIPLVCHSVVHLIYDICLNLWIGLTYPHTWFWVGCSLAFCQISGLIFQSCYIVVTCKVLQCRQTCIMYCIFDILTAVSILYIFQFGKNQGTSLLLFRGRWTFLLLIWEQKTRTNSQSLFMCCALSAYI